MAESKSPTARAPVARPPRQKKPDRDLNTPRAPFLPAEPHPHGWLAKKSLKPK